MNIRLHQLNPVIGDLHYNKNLILEAMAQAGRDGADILMLPELVTSGYPAMDLLEREDFRNSLYSINQEIIAASGKTAIIFGSITENNSKKGRPCFNSAIVAQNGKLLAEVRKALLPTYDVFDELRYFEPDFNFEPVTIHGIRFGITVCEDIWVNDSHIQYHYYGVNPAMELAKKGAQAILNLSASPFTKHSPAGRVAMLQNRAKQVALPLFYVSQTGANTELIFDGDSVAINAKGNLIARAQRFSETHIDIDLKEDGQINAISGGENLSQTPSKPAAIFEALVLGIRDYLSKSKAAEKVILGLSGGLDSALVAVLAKEALGAENVKAITMPSEFSTVGSVSDSEKLAENLGIELLQIPIKSIYDSSVAVLAPYFEGTPFNEAEENLQSRIRGLLLMGMANKFGYMLLNTGNKSELAVGYCTMYGDMAGGLAVLADVYKTEAYELCNWLNDEYYGREVIPQHILLKAPSAELRPDQKDSDSLPEYAILDKILELYIDEQMSREEIIRHGLAENTVDAIIRLVHINEFKRFQAAPGLRISSKAFGSGRRWPVVQRWNGRQYMPEKE